MRELRERLREMRDLLESPGSASARRRLRTQDTRQGLCETTCDARTPTIDHQLMLDYHIPLGYFVLTLMTLFDPIERGWKQW